MLIVERVLKLLLAAGADVNMKTGDCWTPLQYGIIYNNVTAVNLLLDHGAEWNLKDQGGRTLRFKFSDAMVQLLSGRGVITQVMTTPRLRSSHLS